MLVSGPGSVRGFTLANRGKRLNKFYQVGHMPPGKPDCLRDQSNYMNQVG